MKVRLSFVVPWIVGLVVATIPAVAKDSKKTPLGPPENLGPIVNVTFFSANKIQKLPDGNYTAQLDLTGGSGNVQVRFAPEGLTFMSNTVHRTQDARRPEPWTASAAFVYSVFGRSSTIRQASKEGKESADVVYWLIGNRKSTELGGTTNYSW